MHVYQLVAKFVCPLTGMEGRPDREISSSTLFRSPEAAERRTENFKVMIRSRLKVAEDYRIDVTVKAYEVIDD